MALCSFAIAAGVFGMVVLVKRFAFHRRFGGGGPWAFAPCGPSFGGRHHHARWRRHGGPGRSFWLRAVFARLDTTPGQEREIRAAIEELQTATHSAKDGLKDVREDLARAVRGESFDEVAAGEASVRANIASSAVKEAFEAALKRVHAVLDASQRERLAELIAEGPGFGRRWGRPYRDAAR